MREIVIRIGFEPITILQRRTALSCCIKKSLPKMRDYIVIRIGFEPMTYCLEGSCSIQLSYRTEWAANVQFFYLFLSC